MTVEIRTPQSNQEAPFVKRIIILIITVVVSLCSLAVFVPGPIQKNAYMGAEYCGSCHQAEYKSWLSSAHARATDALHDQFATNLSCLNCHATAVLDEKTPMLKGVQCESCHGPGQYYASLHVKKDPVLSKLLFMQKPTVESCRHCHSQSEKLWSPHRAMKEIEHWPISSKGGSFHGEMRP